MNLYRLSSRQILNIIPIFFICFFVGPSAEACLGRTDTPDPGKPQLYKSIFIAKAESFEVKRDLPFHLNVTPAYEAVLSKGIKAIHGKGSHQPLWISMVAAVFLALKLGRSGCFLSQLANTK